MAESNYSRKTLEQIPSLEQLQTLLNPAITSIVQNYAPPMTRTINGHSLEANIWLTAADVGARSNTWLPTPAEINAQPVPRNAVENNFGMFDSNKLLIDSGKNARSFLPAKYVAADNTKVLRVDTTGTVQAVNQDDLLNFIHPYDATKPYRENEVFHFEDPDEGLGIFATVVPHEGNGFRSDQNMLIAKVGIPNAELRPRLTQPVSNANYVLNGTLQQLLQGLLNNVKNLQDRVGAIEDNYVRSDTPKVKLNISSTPSTPQVGYYIVRIDPADVLR